MFEWNQSPRYWSPSQSYATGDVLLTFLSQGWELTHTQNAPNEGRAHLHLVTLKRQKDFMSLLVLDGPAVRDVLSTVG
jgi:hypothetical protein